MLRQYALVNSPIKMMKNFEEFYPTPDELLDTVTKGLKWQRFQTILEPSAGKGNIVEYMMKQGKSNYMEYDIDCIESEPELQYILKGKNMRVVHDDFLTYNGRKKYDLIVMNPPFSNGADHLLKALELQKDGGDILCILNAETINNPCTNKRKDLLQKLTDYEADISYAADAFKFAERIALVEVAIIKVHIPECEKSSFILDELKEGMKLREQDESEATGLAVNDYIKSIVKRFDIEVDACLSLIREYEGMKPYIMERFQSEDRYNTPILSLHAGGSEYKSNMINSVLVLIRRKYWNTLFADERFVGSMTSQQRQDYIDQVEELKNYDFSYYNIKTIQEQMSKAMVSGIEQAMIALFDELSHEYSYLPETGRNIHYYNGWSTNKAHMINSKVIIPMYGLWSKIWKRYDYSYSIFRKIDDIEKVFAYLDGKPTYTGSSNITNPLYQTLQNAEKEQQAKNIECKYFTLNFYKKGTCHITFKDEDLLKKFNIFGSQYKAWLPPCYGKKKYQDMTEEEKQVVNSFEGRETYERVYSQPDKFLVDVHANLMLNAAS